MNHRKYANPIMELEPKSRRKVTLVSSRTLPEWGSFIRGLDPKKMSNIVVTDAKGKKLKHITIDDELIVLIGNIEADKPIDIYVYYDKPNHRVKGNFLKEFWYWVVEWVKVWILGSCPLCGSKTWYWGDREYCRNEKCKYFKEQI